MNCGLHNTDSRHAAQRKQAGIRAWWWMAPFVLCFARGIEAYAGDAIETAGDILQYVIPATAGGLTLGYRDFKGTLQFGGSFLVTEGVTYGLKYTVNETRPNGGSESFPSGHTSVSFCGAEFIRKRYGWELGIPAYAAASFVAYSRVESNEHYPHDVIAGAAIGILSSFILTTPYKGWELKTEAGPGLHGIFLSKSW
jgi:membrane-associated phospholipid phosphatase